MLIRASTASSPSAPTIDQFEHQSSRGDLGLLPDQVWSRSALSFLEWTSREHRFRFRRLQRLGSISRERKLPQGSATTPRTRQEALDIPLERKKRAKHPVRSWRLEFRYPRLSLTEAVIVVILRLSLNKTATIESLSAVTQRGRHSPSFRGVSPS